MKNRIEEIRRAKRMSMDALGQLIGTSASQVNKLEKGDVALRPKWLERISVALDVSIAELLGEEAPAPAEPAIRPAKLTPVYGMVAASAIGHSVMTVEPVEYALTPAALYHVRDAYALYVQGESMVPRYYPNDLIFVHPHKPPRFGDDVVLQEQRGIETIASLKRYDNLEPDFYVCWQWNPATQIKFNRKNTTIHRVLTRNEVIGV